MDRSNVILGNIPSERHTPKEKEAAYLLGLDLSEREDFSPREIHNINCYVKIAEEKEKHREFLVENRRP